MTNGPPKICTSCRNRTLAVIAPCSAPATRERSSRPRRPKVEYACASTQEGMLYALHTFGKARLKNESGHRNPELLELAPPGFCMMFVPSAKSPAMGQSDRGLPSASKCCSQSFAMTIRRAS